MHLVRIRSVHEPVAAASVFHHLSRLLLGGLQDSVAQLDVL